MFDDQLTKACEDMIASYIADLFTRKPMLADALAELPFGDDSCFAGLDRQSLQERVVDALAAREFFELTRPSWGPHLPLTEAENLTLRNSSDRRMVLLGCFGFSLRFVHWKYRWHPDFHSYCRGVLAFSRTPAVMRADPALLHEFPPQRLLTGDGLAFLPLNGDPHAMNG